MSRNNKNARLKALAKEFSKARKSGSRGPSKTVAKHGKRRAWWQKTSRPIPWWDKRGDQRERRATTADD